MAANEIRLATGIYGLSGYQVNGASRGYLQEHRPEQIKVLNRLIDKTRDPQVKERLERALRPWSLWNKEPRFWAFPEFTDQK